MADVDWFLVMSSLSINRIPPCPRGAEIMRAITISCFDALVITPRVFRFMIRNVRNEII